MNDVCRLTHSITPNQISALLADIGVSSVFATGASTGR
jgi:hypothetical protein